MKPTDFFTTPPVQGHVGKRPRAYLPDLPGGAQAYSASIRRIPGESEAILNRDQVREVARDMEVHSLVAYACIMAWGGRNFRNYRLSLENNNSTKVVELVTYLRKSTASREIDFDYTQTAAARIPGLGISFYTKLLFFLRKTRDAYILDQWTAKSAKVLFPRAGVKLTSAGLPDPKTSAKNYGDFCRAIDGCVGDSPSAWGKAWRNGEEVERTMFDRPGGPWRSWLKRH
jgi:hypothetical protein